MKILVDAMGGDNAPLCVLQGVSQAAAEFGDGMELVLLGEEKAIRDCAKENKIDLAPFEILNCTETIDMHDDPVKAVRHKKDSSLVKGLTMLKNGEADAFVSAGSTGALHVGTSLIVRTVKGVKRPALATPMPGAKQNFLLLDCGANVECRPEMLNAFGTMGSVYAEKVMGRETPKVALVNNGAEDTKGTPTYREAHKLLFKDDNAQTQGVVTSLCGIDYNRAYSAVAKGFKAEGVCCLGGGIIAGDGYAGDVGSAFYVSVDDLG